MRLRLVVVHQEVFSEEAQLGSAGSAFGGVVIAEIPDIKDCAEIQKPYPDDEGARVREKTDVRGGEAGCRRLYLETHTNLAAALYEKLVFRMIDKPDFVMHGAMNIRSWIRWQTLSMK